MISGSSDEPLHSTKEDRKSENKGEPLRKVSLSPSSSTDSLRSLLGLPAASNNNRNESLPLNPSLSSSSSLPPSSSTSSSFASIPPSSTTIHTEPKKRLSNKQIFDMIDLKDVKSINEYFKFQKDKGTLPPIASYVGCSQKYNDCFKAIRAWRRLTQSLQEGEREKFKKMPRSQKQEYWDNINFLMTSKNGGRNSSGIIGEVQGKVATNKVGKPCSKEEQVIAAEAHKPACTRMSDRALVQRAMKFARPLNDEELKNIGIDLAEKENVRKVKKNKESSRNTTAKKSSNEEEEIKHVGIASSKEERVRKIKDWL